MHSPFFGNVPPGTDCSPGCGDLLVGQAARYCGAIRYREGQEDQLGALDLVVNALILWTTRYMDAALNHLRAAGTEVRKEDLARLSPLSHKHFNILGRYHFAVPEEVLRGTILRCQL
jgi:hypothetical protein